MGYGYTNNHYGIEWSTGKSGAFDGSTQFTVKELRLKDKRTLETIVHVKPAIGIYQLLNRWNVQGGETSKSWIDAEI